MVTEETPTTGPTTSIVPTSPTGDTRAVEPTPIEKARAKAAELGGNVRQAVEQHPMAALAGGLALGLVVGGAILGGRAMRLRKASPIAAAATAAGLGKKATALAAFAADVASSYAHKAGDAGREGIHKLEDLSHDTGARLHERSVEARKIAGELAEVATHAARDAAELAISRASELAARLKH